MLCDDSPGFELEVGFLPAAVWWGALEDSGERDVE
jgi:hypothetical protein